MPRVCWEEQLCVSCKFVTRFAVYGFFAEHKEGKMQTLYEQFQHDRGPAPIENNR